jgi:hypothetical protein
LLHLIALSTNVSGILSSDVKSMTFGFLDLNLRSLQRDSIEETAGSSGLFLESIFCFFSFLADRGVTLPALSIVKVAEQMMCWIPPARAYSSS